MLTALVPRRVPLAADAVEAAAKDAASLGHQAQLLRDEHRVLASAVAADADVRGEGAHVRLCGGEQSETSYGV